MPRPTWYPWTLLLLLLVLSSYGCAHNPVNIDRGYIDGSKAEPHVPGTLYQDDWPDYREDRDAETWIDADVWEYPPTNGDWVAHRDSILDADFAKASAKSGR